MKPQIDKKSPHKTKSVSLTADSTTADEERFTREMRRAGEYAIMREILLVKRPHNNGERSFSGRDEGTYFTAWNHAQGFDSIFIQLVEAAAKSADARFFEVTSQAMRDVKEARKIKVSCTNGHVVAAIQAKLELERSLDRLPTQKEVKERAFKLVIWLWNTQDFAPYDPDDKRWSKILKAAGLDYLPRGTRGKGKPK